MIVPTAGVTDQFTAVIGLPVTAALNCLDCPLSSATPAGVTVTTIGVNEIWNVAQSCELNEAHDFPTTIVDDEIGALAVYRPSAVMLPNGGLRV